MNRITVVIPCYNAEEYIDGCIHSLQNQLFSDFEVIFVDDASKDNTVRKLENIALNSNLNIQIIKNEKNCGPAKSRNRGILAATTEYITFCDADDWYEVEFLSTLYKGLKKNNADLAICGYSVVDEKGNKEKRPLNQSCVVEKKEDMLGIDVDSLCMLMVKTTIMKDTLLPDIRNGEDMAVVPLLMMKANKCLVIRECLYNYYRRSGSASETVTMKVVDSFVESFNHIREHFPKGYVEIEEYIGVRNLLYAGLITLFSFSYDIKKANKILGDFEKSYPNWIKNDYIEEMPRYKVVVLKLAHNRYYVAIWVLAKLRKILTRKK